MDSWPSSGDGRSRDHLPRALHAHGLVVVERREAAAVQGSGPWKPKPLEDGVATRLHRFAQTPVRTTRDLKHIAIKNFTFVFKEEHLKDLFQRRDLSKDLQPNNFTPYNIM